MTVVEVGGVRTWYTEQGAGTPLVLLHGALTDSRCFGANAPALAGRYRVVLPDRRGHGRTGDVEGPITYDLMAADTVALLEALDLGPAHLVGHSDGANVAMLVALSRPDLVDRLVLISGNFHHDGLIPGAVEIADLGESDFLADAYGGVSPDGRGHFPVLVAKVDRMVAEEPTLTVADLARIRARTLVMVGDDDAIDPRHTLALYGAIAGSELAVVPGTSHALIMERPELCNGLVLEFLAAGPRQTLMPVRRR